MKEFHIWSKKKKKSNLVNNKRKYNPTTFILYKSASDLNWSVKLRLLSQGCLGQTHINSMIVGKKSITWQIKAFGFYFLTMKKHRAASLSHWNNWNPYHHHHHLVSAPFLALCRLRAPVIVRRTRVEEEEEDDSLTMKRKR